MGLDTRQGMPASRTRHAVLGALTFSPKSGYELKQFFERSVQFFWHESFGQIYPTLAQLERESLIEAVPAERKGATRYAITQSGRDALALWLEEPPEPQVNRVELLLKLLFASEGEPDAVVRHLREFGARQASLVATYGALKEQLESEERSEKRLQYWLLTLSYGRHLSDALLRWSKEAEAVMVQMGKKPPRSRRSAVARRAPARRGPERK